MDEGSSAGGLAFLSAYPLEEVFHAQPEVAGSFFPGACVAVRTPAGIVDILNVHLRWVNKQRSLPCPCVPHTHPLVTLCYTAQAARLKQPQAVGHGTLPDRADPQGRAQVLYPRGGMIHGHS
jgi:hypothetical protein